MNEKLEKFLYWLLQIGTWTFLILVFLSSDIGGNHIQDKDNEYIYLFVIFYLTYCVFEFKSKTFDFIRNKDSCDLIHQKLGMFFRAYPEIHFDCDCYHNETGHIHIGTGSSIKRKITHSEHYTLPYYSERDVSGLFYLDIDRAKASSKNYIRLDFYEEINFADAISYMDYEYQKDSFWRRNRFRDVRFDFTESRIIPGMTRTNIVKLTENEPCCVGPRIFAFMIILTFGELYKLYFDSLCWHQIFRIRKLVSTRYDLNQPQYQCFNPQINLINQQYNYNPNDYVFINPQYKVQEPTDEELRWAKRYEDKIPDYKISSGNGQFQAGVVIDDQSYCSYNPEEPPPAFASYGCNVVLEKDQINTNGDLPPGFIIPNWQLVNEEGDTDESNNQFQLNVNKARKNNQQEILKNNSQKYQNLLNSTKRQIYSRKKSNSKKKNNSKIKK